MKKILTSLIVILSVFLIYLGFKDEKVYYLSLGDSLANGINQYGTKDYGYANYVKDYLKKADLLEVYVQDTVTNNKTSIDIINDINDNIEVDVGGKTKTFQNVLIKADLITLSLGTNDLLNNLEFDNDFSINDLYNKLDKVIKDYEKLFELLRKYCKERIIFIGIYDPTNNLELSDFFQYANAKLSNLCIKYNINYIDIYNDFKNNDYISSEISSFPNKDGYKLIADKIISFLEKI